MTQVKVSDQVESFVKSLAPEPRGALTRAIKGLATNRGDCRRLEGDLVGYHRLRVLTYRVVYHETFSAGQRSIECVYAAPRSVVYELFATLLKNRLPLPGRTTPSH